MENELKNFSLSPSVSILIAGVIVAGAVMYSRGSGAQPAQHCAIR